MKRFLSAFLCFTITLFSVTAAFAASDGSAAEAAKVYETPYYYNQLTKEAQETYDALKKAVLECDGSLKVRSKIDQEDFNQIAELLVFHDPMTFNLEDIEASSVTSASVTFKLKYRYKKETYDKMTAAYSKKADKILDKLTDDMSVYKKIKTIHDSLINGVVYDLESPTNDTVYGALVKKKAKCDGYAKTFSYICGQAGIRTVTVIGDDKEDQSDIMHMWNKVYYNKNWYNVDVTWDDPVGNYKNNLQYDFFMVSDKVMSKTHVEDNFSFEVPEAKDSSKDYFTVNKKCAGDLKTAKSLLNKALTSAASKGKSSATIKCSSKEVFDDMKEYILDAKTMHGVLDGIGEKKNSDLVSEIYSYGFNENQYIIRVYIFYDGTDLEDYFLDPTELGSDERDVFARCGID